MAASKKRAPKKGTPNSTTKRARTCKGKSCCNVLESAMRGEMPRVVDSKAKPIKAKRPVMDAIACEVQLPLCPTGTACVFGRDQAQNVVCYPAPTTGGRLVLCGEGGVIFWGAAP